MEQMLVGHLILNPAELGNYTNAQEVIVSPLARSALDALIETPDGNIAMITERMRRGGVEVTTDTIERDLLGNVKKFGINPQATWRMLQELYLNRTGTPLFAQYRDKILTGQMSPIEAADALSNDIRDLAPDKQLTMISTDEWGGDYGARIAEHRRQLVNDNRMARPPEEFFGLVKKAPYIEHGIISLMMDSGRGKTILADTWAHSLAEVQGHNVVFGASEAGLDEMRFRSFCRRDRSQKFSELMAGAWDTRMDKLALPYKSGGKVIYVECAGAKLTQMIALAKRHNAHLFLDLFADLSITDFYEPGKTYSQQIEKALVALETYCQDNKRIAFITLQTNNEGRKAARQEGHMGAENAKDSGAFFTKSKLFLVGQSKISTHGTVINHPIEEKEIIVPEKQYPPVVNFMIMKNRLGGGEGIGQVCFLDGAHFTFIPYRGKEEIQRIMDGYL